MSSNPVQVVRDIRRPTGALRANRPWSDEERYAVLDAAPAHLKVPIALAMFCGMREGDALTIPRSAYDGRTIQFETRKTGQRISWPVPQVLRSILNEAISDDADTLATTSRGQEWTESGFRASWRKLRIGLEAEGKVEPGLTIHGLRHTVATILREEGFDDRTIADVLGQKTEHMARHYSRDADLTQRMAAVAERFDQAENKRRAKVVELPEKVSNLQQSGNQHLINKASLNEISS